MEPVFYGITVLISLLGGIVILSRSGASHGRAFASGLLCIAAFETSYMFYFFQESLLSLRVASFFELSTIGFFVVAVISIEKNISKNLSLIFWTKRIFITICLLYGMTLLLFPGEYASIYAPNVAVIGRLGYVHTFLVLIGAIVFVWIMENILRSSQGASRRVLTYPALGCISVGAAMCMASIFRLSTNTITNDVLVLCSLITLVGVTFLIFFSIRFKLFEMDIFVSRYVVYHSFTLISIGAYLVVTGIVVFWVQHLGIRSSLVVSGFMVFLALIVLSLVVLSPETRARMRFFINTHFFSNKYDYRKEWGELSGYLAIAFNEQQILHVASQVILDSMYIRELSIWLKKGAAFIRPISFPDLTGDTTITEPNPLISYLRDMRYFMRSTPSSAADTAWEGIVKNHQEFLKRNKIELAVGMMAGSDMIGFIAVGKENPGTPYGQDDIDLLVAISSQVSSALMKVWFADKLVENRELDTFNRMSASVLHDLKNAAGHLSLILQNAPRHMDQEEFRSDMLDTIGQALARIDKVMGKFQAVPEREVLQPKTFRAGPFLDGLMERLRPRFSGIDLAAEIEPDMELNTDPEVLERILENIIVNAAEAVEVDGHVGIVARMEGDMPFFAVIDNGMGMTEAFIREKLFKPFQTTKKTGTGIGMWQVKNMVDQLGARIEIKRNEDRGVTVSLWIPGRESGAEET